MYLYLERFTSYKRMQNNFIQDILKILKRKYHYLFISYIEILFALVSYSRLLFKKTTM